MFLRCSLTCDVHGVLAQEPLARRPPHELPEAAEGGLARARGALPVLGVLQQVAGGSAQPGVLLHVAAVGKIIYDFKWFSYRILLFTY